MLYNTIVKLKYSKHLIKLKVCLKSNARPLKIEMENKHEKSN